MKYAIYAGIALFVIYNFLTGDMASDLGISIPHGGSIRDTLASLI